MDTQEEVRTAVLAILRAHIQMRADYQALIGQLFASNLPPPELWSALQQIPDASESYFQQESTQTARLEGALRDWQPFAALLQEYATLWRPSLDDTIQSLKLVSQHKKSRNEKA